MIVVATEVPATEAAETADGVATMTTTDVVRTPGTKIETKMAAS